MSFQVNKLIKQKFPKNKNNTINININPDNKNKLDPGIFHFLKKSQNSPKNNEISTKTIKRESLSENICNSIIQKEEKNYIEENDKEIKLGAQKGLLYLLNELSKGKFFPEINDFFDKMKDIKLEELRMKQKQKNSISNNININNNIKEDEDSDLFNRKNSQKKHVTLNVGKQIRRNKNEEISQRPHSKSVTKSRKILKEKKINRSKKKIKITFKSDSKNNIKDNSNINETSV